MSRSYSRYDINKMTAKRPAGSPEWVDKKRVVVGKEEREIEYGEKVDVVVWRLASYRAAEILREGIQVRLVAPRYARGEILGVLVDGVLKPLPKHLLDVDTVVVKGGSSLLVKYIEKQRIWKKKLAIVPKYEMRTIPGIDDKDNEERRQTYLRKQRSPSSRIGMRTTSENGRRVSFWGDEGSSMKRIVNRARRRGERHIIKEQLVGWTKEEDRHDWEGQLLDQMSERTTQYNKVYYVNAMKLTGFRKAA